MPTAETATHRHVTFSLAEGKASPSTDVILPAVMVGAAPPYTAPGHTRDIRKCYRLWHPDGALTLRDFRADRGLPYKDSGLPIPVETFCAYGEAFRNRFEQMLDERPAAKLERDPDGFLLRLRDGTSATANRVVIATGIGSFPYTPPELDPIAGPLCSHSIEHHSLDRFTGQDVLIVGGGASGMELAGLMSAKGSRVPVVTCQDRIPFCDPPRPRGLWEQLQAPETGLGTSWRSVACVTAPMLFYQMPRGFRRMVVRKHLLTVKLVWDRFRFRLG